MVGYPVALQQPSAPSHSRSLRQIRGPGIVDPGLWKEWDRHEGGVMGPSERYVLALHPTSGFGMGEGDEKSGQLSNLFCAAERTPTCH